MSKAWPLSASAWLAARLAQWVYRSPLGRKGRQIWRIDAVLYLGGRAGALIMAVWCLVYALLANGPGCAMTLLGTTGCLLAQHLAQHPTLKPGRRWLASGLLFGSILACVTLSCLFFDPPSPDQPRTTHLFLLALAVLAHLLLEDQGPGLGFGVAGLCLGLFLVFASTGLGWPTPWSLPPRVMHWGAWLNGFASLGALALALAGAQLKVEKRGHLLLDLRRALPRGELRLMLQAQVNRDGETVGAEVLLRWQHPRLGLLPAQEFIDLAERSGFILPIGHWVLRETCQLLAAWRSHAQLRRLTLAINISGAQLREPDFVRQVHEALLHCGAPPTALLLEVSESLLANEASAVVPKLHALAALGVACSLSEFGSRVSSLSQLQELPLSDLKMHPAFVRELDTNPRSASITEAVLSLGRQLHLRVVAEGVETREQWALLSAQGCQYFQGHLFGPPLAARDFSASIP